MAMAKKKVERLVSIDCEIRITINESFLAFPDLGQNKYIIVCFFVLFLHWCAGGRRVITGKSGNGA